MLILKSTVVENGRFPLPCFQLVNEKAHLFTVNRWAFNFG